MSRSWAGGRMPWLAPVRGPRTGHWVATVRDRNGMLVHLGFFKTKEQAEAAVISFSTLHFGPFPDRTHDKPL